MDFEYTKPPLTKQWSGNDFEREKVLSGLEAVFMKHDEELKAVPAIKFDKFVSSEDNAVEPNVEISANPTNNGRPCILLTGLEQENEMIMEPKEIKNNCDIFLLLATSGMGKTRTIFQYLSKHFGLYFTPSDPSILSDELSHHFGPRDFLNIQNKLDTFAESSKTENLAIIKRYIKCLILARLLILERILCYSPEATPLNWLVFQLKNSKNDTIFNRVALAVKDFTESDLSFELGRVREFFANHTSFCKTKRLPCVFDESQYLIRSGLGRFPSLDGTEGRPFYSAMVDSVLHLFGDQRNSQEFNTLFWASGTGLNIQSITKYSLSQIARNVSILEHGTINNILENSQAVYEYLCHYLPRVTVNSLDPYHLAGFVGRRRFSSLLIENILLQGPEKIIVEKTRNNLISQMEETWENIPKKIQIGNCDLRQFIDLSKRLISAFLITGGPIIVQNRERSDLVDALSIALFENGIGILEYSNVKCRVSLKEPIVMIAGDRILGVTENLIFCQPGITLSSLGYMWEHSIARKLQQHACGNNGMIDTAVVFGINQHELSKTPLVTPLELKNYGNEKFLSNMSILDFIKTDNLVSPLICPDKMAGPDLVFKLGEYVVFCQAKFSDKLSLGQALLSVTPSQFYKDKTGKVPNRFQDEHKDIIQFLKGKTVIRMIYCYPHTVKTAAWKSHFRVLETRASPRNNETSMKFIDILVDSRNSQDFFGQKEVDSFDTIRKQSEIFGLMEVPSNFEDESLDKSINNYT
jgi:hypothetical protein